MIRLALLSFFFFVLSLSSCGVKAPPVAPDVRIEEKAAVNCSPQDPKCDLMDPNYKPHKR